MPGIELKKDFSLKNHNSFGVNSTARAFVRVTSEAQLFYLPELLSRYSSYLLLGGGSNMLLPDFYDGLVVKIDIQKYSLRESGKDVLVNVGAGVNWHTLVSDSVKRNLGGIENLALIPGNAGAAPIQNIGAYGVELKDVFVCLRGMDLEKGELKCFDLAKSEFAYRDSVFKRKWKDKLIISELWIKLTEANYHQPNISYAALKDFLIQKNIFQASISDVFNAVVDIRKSKLPDPEKIGNAGSFFKNPVVSEEKLNSLLEEYPYLVHYPVADGLTKIPAAWLIDKAGLKGASKGPVGTHNFQPLVIVNHGGATASQIVDFAGWVQKCILNQFGILLEPEVNIVQSGENDGLLQYRPHSGNGA